jgi:L-asparaginase/Glu-tRNA(Gln) amidotransferase subunit D
MLTAATVSAANVDPNLPAIAVFAGPTATVLNTDPPRTSLKAREKYGLPPMRDWYGRNVQRDVLIPQRLAAPVTVYVEQFSAHPLEKDSADLFAPPDGYLDANNQFHRQRTSPADRPVYEITLKPEDGLYPLPYMARRADGSAWDDWHAAEGSGGRVRQTFYPDGARLFEEIERMAATTTSNIFARAHFDFYRPAPPAGYTRGLPANERTDAGSGDIPPEQSGRDFFPYGYDNFNPTRAMLARITNEVQATLASGKYRGAFWLEGSPRIEDTIYWWNLVIDSDALFVGIVANRGNHYLSADGPATVVDAIDLVLSDAWRDERGQNRTGAVIVQDQHITAAREATKQAARPGGFGTVGGTGGVLGAMPGQKLSFIPTTRHGRTSDVRFTVLPKTVTGVQRNADGKLQPVTVAVKDDRGQLRGEAIPYVELLEFNEWMTANPPGAPDPVVNRVQSAIDRALGESPLVGLVVEGQTGGHFDTPDARMIDRAAASGLVIVKVFRDNPGMYVNANPNALFVAGSNLNATKARILLMAALLRYGNSPPAADPANPTPTELAAIRTHLANIQAVFDTH